MKILYIHWLPKYIGDSYLECAAYSAIDLLLKTNYLELLPRVKLRIKAIRTNVGRKNSTGLARAYARVDD